LQQQLSLSKKKNLRKKLKGNKMKNIIILVLIGLICLKAYSILTEKNEEPVEEKQDSTKQELVKPNTQPTIPSENEFKQMPPPSVPTGMVGMPLVHPGSPLPINKEPERDPRDAQQQPQEQPPQHQEPSNQNLVSCETKARFCEPQGQLNFPDPDMVVICSTLVQNCSNPDAAQPLPNAQPPVQNPQEQQPQLNQEQQPQLNQEQNQQQQNPYQGQTQEQQN
jgi:hypothetical protein